MKEQIHFYYTNDLHSHFEHWPRVMTFMKARRADHERRGESSFLFDIGDHMDRVHPITEASLGQANIRLLNEAGYDFATIGNNEGVTLPHEEMYHLYDNATFDVICSNLNCTRSPNPKWLQNARVVESMQGTRIGIIGLTARFNPYYNLLGWHADAVQETIARELNELSDKVDIIVLMSHLGITEDEEIARAFPEIDLIMGGHTHHLLRTGQQTNETLLTAAGKLCNYVGQVNLTYDHHRKKLIKKEAYTSSITHLPSDEATVELLHKLKQTADEKLQAEITYASKPIEADWYTSSDIMEKLTEQVLLETGADCAMLNAGLLLEGFPSGVITYKDVHKVCPHPINPCVVSLTGDELTEVIRASLTETFMTYPLKGFGFRGEVIGRMVFANLEIDLGTHSDDTTYVENIYFQNQPLEQDRIYDVATADMFTFGRLLPPIARSPKKELFLPAFIREILVNTLKKLG